MFKMRRGRIWTRRKHFRSGSEERMKNRLFNNFLYTVSQWRLNSWYFFLFQRGLNWLVSVTKVLSICLNRPRPLCLTNVLFVTCYCLWYSITGTTVLYAPLYITRSCFLSSFLYGQISSVVNEKWSNPDPDPTPVILNKFEKYCTL